MGKNGSEYDSKVSVSIELQGEYSDVMSRLDTEAAGGPELATLLADLEALVETVDRIGGGTRSKVVDNLPSDMAAQYDAEGVVTALQVLERYGLVVLDGNTWYPATQVE